MSLTSPGKSLVYIAGHTAVWESLRVLPMTDALLAPKRGKEGACTSHNNGLVLREVPVIRLTLGSPLCYMSRSALEET